MTTKPDGLPRAFAIGRAVRMIVSEDYTISALVSDEEWAVKMAAAINAALAAAIAKAREEAEADVDRKILAAGEVLAAGHEAEMVAHRSEVARLAGELGSLKAKGEWLADVLRLVLEDYRQWERHPTKDAILAALAEWRQNDERS